jgi:hypothetical protein
MIFIGKGNEFLVRSKQMWYNENQTWEFKLCISYEMAEAKTSVSFVCQRCLQPLRLDSAFGNLGEHTLAELTRKL